LRPRLIAGPLYLQHAFNFFDEQVMAGWLEHPYWQVFTGETHLQTEPPIDVSSLLRWRQRLGEIGMEEMLAQSIDGAKRAKVIRLPSVQRVIVRTTVTQKAVAYSTDSALLDSSRRDLVKAARRCSLHLRKNYNRGAPPISAADWPLCPYQTVSAHVCILARPALAGGTGSPRNRSTSGSGLSGPTQAARRPPRPNWPYPRPEAQG
jgi:hypothetical protein